LIYYCIELIVNYLYTKIKPILCFTASFLTLFLIPNSRYLELEYHFFLTQASEESQVAGIKISTVESIQNDPFPANQEDYIEKDVIFRISDNQK